jgi:hypothetical protein
MKRIMVVLIAKTQRNPKPQSGEGNDRARSGLGGRCYLGGGSITYQVPAFWNRVHLG